MHYISLWWARGEDKSTTFVFCIKQSHLIFVCLRAALSNVMYMSVSFGFVSLISFAVSTVLLGEEKMKENSILKRSEHLACKKIENKLKKVQGGRGSLFFCRFGAEIFL